MDSIYKDIFPLTLDILKEPHPYFEERGLSPSTIERLPLGTLNGEPVAYFGREDQVYGVNRVAVKKTLKHSKVLPFNGDRLFEQHEFLFITEGWADAASIEELGARAVSINGIGNTKRMVKEIGLINNKETIYIILYDNDITKSTNKGKIHEDFFVEELMDKKIKTIGADIGDFINSSNLVNTYGEPLKDFNDLLLYNRALAIEFLREVVARELDNNTKADKLIKKKREAEGF